VGCGVGTGVGEGVGCGDGTGVGTGVANVHDFVVVSKWQILSPALSKCEWHVLNLPVPEY
jgi:hypothetical protein